MTPGPDTDVTIVAVGTSVTWSTGNHYQHKFPTLVHRDLNGDYPLDEKYLHYNTGEKPSEPRYPYDGEDNYPEPTYYRKTKEDGYIANPEEHPRGPHLPPSQYRARGGAIIGLDWPAKVTVGTKRPADVVRNDNGGYRAGGPDGKYDGKLDGLGNYASIDSNYTSLFTDSDINRSKWLLMRDIGWGWPTIVDQIQQFDSGGTVWESPADIPQNASPDPFEYQLPSSPPDGKDVDLVLMDGGTNDMQLGWLNNPNKANRHDIFEASKLYLYDNMTGPDGLLQQARRMFPNAVIVLIGYPVWTSNRSDYDRVREFLGANSPWVGGFSPVAESAIDNPLTFSHFQSYWLRRAVTETSRTDDGPGMIFAPPGWGVVNSMMADWPWSFGAKVSDFHPVYSPDDTWQQRDQVCEAESAWESRQYDDSDDESDEIGMIPCRAASVGHPNNEGCRQYADTIVRRYKEYVDLSLGSVTDELDGGTDSLRRAVDRYGFGPGGNGLRQPLSGPERSLRWTLSHRVVDSIMVKLETGNPNGSTAPGAKKGRPHLVVYPGRSGSGERFPLDTEARDYGPGETDWFYIDPMMRRRITGPPGNVDKGEKGVKTGRTEPAEQTIHPPGHWSDRRLRLGDVEHLTIELDGVDPNDGWALEEVGYEINGAISGRRDLSADFQQRDFRARTRPSEFQVASFNRVDGVSTADLRLDVRPTGFDGRLGRTVRVAVDVRVANKADQRVPSSMLQYGIEVNGSGRDWRTTFLPDLAPGESWSRTVTLEATHDLAFHTGTIAVRSGLFVGESSRWESETTSRRDLR
jgi:hypothetical protein